MPPEEENTPLGGGFGTLPDDPRLDAVFGDPEPTEEQASPPEEGEAQAGAVDTDTAQDTAQPPVGETGEPQVETEAVDTDTAQPAEDPAATEVPPEGYTFAGRTYRTQEEAERSYREMQGYVTRTRQEQAAFAQRMDERQRQQEEAIAQLLGQAQYDRAQQDPEYAAQLELQKQLEPLVRQQIEPMQLELQERLRAVEMERQKVKIDAALDPFFRDHPDVAEGTPANVELARTVFDLHSAWEQAGVTDVMDMSDPAALELAYECYKDPDLLVVLQTKPFLTDSDRGLDYARKEAMQMKGSRGATAQGGTPPQPQGVKKVVGQRADVEVPGGRAPASREPQNEWEEVLALEAEDAKNPNPFLGGRR